MRLRILASFFFALVATTSARADAVYNYVGQKFTIVTGQYTTDDFIHGYVAFATALAPNLDNVELYPSDWFLQDGVQTVDRANSGISFGGSTDAEGNLIYWEVTAETGDYASEAMSNTPEESGCCSTFPAEAGDVSEILKGAGPDYGANMAAGTFTRASVTPEPSSLILLGTGVMGLVGALRRRFI